MTAIATYTCGWAARGPKSGFFYFQIYGVYESNLVLWTLCNWSKLEPILIRIYKLIYERPTHAYSMLVCTSSSEHLKWNQVASLITTPAPWLPINSIYLFLALPHRKGDLTHRSDARTCTYSIDCKNGLIYFFFFFFHPIRTEGGLQLQRGIFFMKPEEELFQNLLLLWCS